MAMYVEVAIRKKKEFLSQYSQYFPLSGYV